MDHYDQEEHLEDEYYDDAYEDDDDVIDDDYGEPEYEHSQEENVGNLRPLQTVLVKIHDILLSVSNTGIIHKQGEEVFLGTRGYRLEGTPYRTYPIAGRVYFVHDIVWRAFHGEPPQGWEVRHVQSQKRKVYDNSLHYLTIMPKIVEYHPTLFDNVS